MADYDPPPRPTGYRLRMACQECRKRKIKCDGGKPCNICQRRGTSCLYRDIVRRRMRRHQNNKHEDAPTKMPKLPSGICEAENAQSPNEELSASNIPHDQGSTVKYSFNHGVSATDTASPLTTVQLYYGSTSQFAFMHEFHQEMMPDRADQSNETRGGVMETGPGLDMFNFRPIFFGRPFETDGASGKPGDGGTGELVVLIDKDLAKTFLERYLSTSYYLATFRPAENFRRHLESLYSPVPGSEIDTWSRLVIFMALALGSLGTTHCEWGDILFQRVNDTITSMSDVFQTEQGRFNSSFLHLGTAARKAISAGLHKEPPANSDDGSESVEERRDTFWSLYFYETWVTFHLGRPSAISPRDINIKPSANPFLQTLVTLCQVIHRSVDGINGQHEKSLLQMWHIARSVMDNLRTYDACMRRALGTGLSSKPRPGSLGVQQTILITLYYHAILLTYRPFLLFRRRWHRTPHDPAQAAGAGAQMPNWLNEACNCALNAACRTIEYLCEAALTNELVRVRYCLLYWDIEFKEWQEARYHGYFLSSACFVLAYNIVHGENESSVPSYIPWIHAAIRCLESMRPGDPINTFIAAIRNILTKISSLCQLRQSAMKDKLFVPDFEQSPPFGIPKLGDGVGNGETHQPPSDEVEPVCHFSEELCSTSIDLDHVSEVDLAVSYSDWTRNLNYELGGCCFALS